MSYITSYIRENISNFKYTIDYIICENFTIILYIVLMIIWMLNIKFYVYYIKYHLYDMIYIMI